jgi:hypothetical protein
MVSTGGKEEAAVTALCAAPAVILDAEVFAALAARELLDVAHAAFDDRIRFVPLTASLLRANALRHLYDGFVDPSYVGIQITSYADASTDDQRLAQAAQIRVVAARWDADWNPPRAEAAVMSLLAARTHGIPLVTAYPEARQLLARPAGLCRVIDPWELALFLAHRGRHSAAIAAALAIDLGATFEPRRSAWWSAQLPRYVSLAALAASGSLCDAHSEEG